MAQFFLRRPAFAWVLAILTMVAGLVALNSIPVAQYPAVAPPTVILYADYPGATARTVEDRVTAVLEQQMHGIPGLLYIDSSSEAGTATVTIGFRQGTDPQLAQVNVRNRVSQAEPLLPEVVRRGGVYVDQASASPFMYVSLISKTGTMSETALADYAAGTVLPMLRRLPGIGKVEAYSAEYALRVWFNPDQLNAYGLTTADVEAAIRARNGSVTPGQLGGAPSKPGQSYQAVVRPPAPLADPEAFGRIVLRSAADGSAVLLRDVARVEMAAADYRYSSTLNGREAASMGLKLADGANVLATSRTVRDALDEAAKAFPAGVAYDISYDTAHFVQSSISRVLMTLAEATVLVFLILYLFLGNLRATLIPCIVVPVSLLGTVACLYAFGLSLNVITLFGVVLAIGILVDDAIVVVENVERIMREEGVDAFTAASRSMREVSGALLAVTLVLCAVFVPMAFLGSAVGVIYRHFAMTLAISIAFSLFFALSLAPAMCASLLRHGAQPARGPLAWFEHRFTAFTTRYAGWVQRLQQRRLRWLAVYLAMAAVCAVGLWQLPSGFLPEEDTGELVIDVELPPGSTQAQTRETIAQLEQWMKQERLPVKTSFALLGWNSGGSGEQRASVFLSLDDWKLRGRENAADVVLARLTKGLEEWPGRGDAQLYPYNGTALPELGSTSGLDMRLVTRLEGGRPSLYAARDKLIERAKADPVFAEVRATAGQPVPALDLAIDYRKAESFGVDTEAIHHALAATLGSRYIDELARDGRVRRVILQADAPFRMQPEDLARLHVRNAQGQMVSLGAFATLEWGNGEATLERYNGLISVRINADVAPGTSTGTAMTRLESLVRELGPDYEVRWSGRAFEQQQSGTQAPWLFALSMLFIFLCLVALYESWTLPLAVLAIVPAGLVGAASAVWLRGLPNDVYFKVGVIVIMGLAAKNAILVVEYAEQLRRNGLERVQAATQAARQRLRPVVMTSLAFILGVVPLAISTGPGAGAQRAVGTGVLGGMLGATILGTLVIPLLYAWIARWSKARATTEPAKAPASEPGA
ncbi:multidrug efflux RND transporter permease subunit [Cupriavidus metallidurans]|uniref:Efflux pump membrane transporter n=1 Tax=Cupriavidus metallidurans (strain ATCC 43123 / DSM 2839 / NBRC 102507 / CH34) TaxID=266264 RepID=Q1LPB9_CUPMC|nr:multidrug efflux RND transporter permease subunit [Cupriavidus metallidurans]ABF08007.1 aminoglycoside/multidrug efflux system [Cupriavidus metallidurans CH34]QGS27714.1 multidrug efflux RND transporter permease subunit [Cupriavidus metallidurans]